MQTAPKTWEIKRKWRISKIKIRLISKSNTKQKVEYKIPLNLTRFLFEGAKIGLGDTRLSVTRGYLRSVSQTFYYVIIRLFAANIILTDSTNAIVFKEALRNAVSLISIDVKSNEIVLQQCK
jgi:hypothetical protein